MTIQLNPTVNDPVDARTLAQMRQMVFDGLGFLPPLTGVGAAVTRTLASLRADIKTRIGVATKNTDVTDTLLNIRTAIKAMLGIAVPNPVGTDTLVNIRTEIYNMLGYAAMATHPPGVDTMLNSFINEAQQSLHRSIELDEGATSLPPKLSADGDVCVLDRNAILQRALGLAKSQYGQDDGTNYLQESEKYLKDVAARKPPAIDVVVNGYVNQAQQTLFRALELDTGTASAPAKLVADGDTTVLDATAITELALAYVKMHYGKEDAAKYLEASNKYLADRLRRGPPNIDAQITAALQDAQRVVARRIEMQYLSANDLPSSLAPFVADTDVTSFDAEPIYLLALASMKSDLKQEGAKQVFEEFEQYMAHVVKRQPPDAVSLVNRLLKQAQDTLFRAYKVFRMERWFTWTTVANQRFYGIAADDNSALAAPTNVTAVVGAATTAQNLTVARSSPAAVMLQNGKILLAGGTNGGVTAPAMTLSSAELYDPATATFVATGSMSTSRANPAATRLLDGRVFIAGGYFGDFLNTTEIYNPATGTFSPGPNLSVARETMTAVTLQSGKVLILGGIAAPGTVSTLAEIFDPAANTITSVGALNTARLSATATVLPTGKVAVIGGQVGLAPSALATAEIFDPATNTFALLAGTMTSTRTLHAAQLLLDGTVLIVGGLQGGVTALATAEIFSPQSGTFSAASGVMAVARSSPCVTLLQNGKVLVSASGAASPGSVYDPSSKTFAATANNETYFTNRGASAFTLASGKALVVGGTNAGGSTEAVNSAQYYDPVTNLYSASGSLTVGTVYYRVATLSVNGSTIPSLPEASVAGVPASTSVVVSWTPVASSAVTGYAIYGRATGAELLIATVGPGASSYTDLGTIVPAGAMPTSNTTGTIGTLDAREVTWVGLSQGDNNWRPLVKGVPPTTYSASWTGPPVYYDIRQAIEVWPAPLDASWLIRIKGYFAPVPFNVDTDYVTIDWQAVYLRALADAKAHYNQPDAGAVEQRLKLYIGDLVAGTHATARYFPNGGRVDRYPPRPILLP